MYVSVWVFYYYLFFFFFQSPPFAEAYLEFSFFFLLPLLSLVLLSSLFSLLFFLSLSSSLQSTLKSFLLWSDLNGVGLRIAFFLFSSFCRFLFVQISFISTQSVHCGSYLWLSLVLTSLRHENFPCDSFLLARLIWSCLVSLFFCFSPCYFRLEMDGRGLDDGRTWHSQIISRGRKIRPSPILLLPRQSFYSCGRD